MTVKRLDRCAKLGSDSPNRSPGTEVSIDLKGPRIDAGASGLGSNVSSWLTPPVIRMRIARRFEFITDEDARAAPDNPTTVRPPARRKSRRETPSASVMFSAANIRDFLFRPQCQIAITMYRHEMKMKTTLLTSAGNGPVMPLIGHTNGVLGLTGQTCAACLSCGSQRLHRIHHRRSKRKNW